MEEPRIIKINDLKPDKFIIADYNFETKKAKILYDNDEDFCILTDVMDIRKCTEDYIDICSSLLVNMITDIEKQLICSISENSENWFKNKFEVDELDDMFLSSVKYNSVPYFRVYYDKTDMYIYDSEYSVVSYDDFISKNHEKMKMALRCELCQFNDRKCQIKWKSIQVMTLPSVQKRLKSEPLL